MFYHICSFHVNVNMHAGFGDIETKRIYQVGPSDGEGSPGPDQTESRNEGFKEIEEMVTFLFTRSRYALSSRLRVQSRRTQGSLANEVQTD